MKSSVLIVLALFTAACASTGKNIVEPPPTPPDPVPEHLLELESSFKNHFENHTLPADAFLMPLSWITSELREKAKSIATLLPAFEEWVKDEDVATGTYAAYRAGQLSLNYGCDVLTMTPPIDLTPDQQAAFFDGLKTHADALVARGLKAMTFVSQRELAPFSEHADLVVAAHRDAESIADFCRKTGQFWQGSRRSIATIAALRCDEEEASFCLAMARAQRRISAEEATPSFIHACELGEARACDEGLELVLTAESPDLDIADRLMQRRCVSDSAPHCRARIQLVHLAYLSRYERDCNAGIGLACLKLATVLAQTHGWDAEPDATCDGLAAPTMEEAEAKTACAEGSPSACWLLAGHLQLLPPRVDEESPESVSVFGRGVGGMGLRGQSASENWDEHCSEGDLKACIVVANRIQGDEPERAQELYRKACDGNEVAACHSLARLLSSDDSRFAEAARLFHKSCVQGYNSSCLELSKAYQDGTGAAKSRSCALHFTWKACTRNAFHCNALLSFDDAPKN